ncbi:SHOCT domain-containing protein [Dactylosporangium vinaceum]|uniref:SHOCT domain-containing protein n=1 Tax=Dactylosporangium vinaceum TaxID=53362 RepID=A0ABV5MK94_9ACTN|nr:SHOCT domain-containing protein [Dactylosporangium vinaceum]UAB99629.1 SHOCT domain-containing protein [Dactylosporangium vinaceum]
MINIVLFGVAFMVACIPVGILGSSNIVWGEDNQYGRVPIPGNTVLHLPAGSVRVSVAIALPGRGNATPDLPFPPDLALTLTPLDTTSGQPAVTRIDATSSNADDNSVNTQRQAWTVHIPQDGSYRVTVQGSFDRVGVNPQLWFGHGPPLPGRFVPLVGLGLVIVAYTLWFVVVRPRRRSSSPATAGPAAGLTTWRRPLRSAAGPAREPRPSGEPPERGARPDPAIAPADSVDRLAKLADLHDRGALTDAEFATEKAKIINGP